MIKETIHSVPEKHKMYIITSEWIFFAYHTCIEYKHVFSTLWQTETYTTGKKYGIFFISAILCIFVEGAGCFCPLNAFLQADFTSGELIST